MFESTSIYPTMQALSPNNNLVSAPSPSTSQATVNANALLAAIPHNRVTSGASTSYLPIPPPSSLNTVSPTTLPPPLEVTRQLDSLLREGGGLDELARLGEEWFDALDSTLIPLSAEPGFSSTSTAASRLDALQALLNQISHLTSALTTSGLGSLPLSSPLPSPSSLPPSDSQSTLEVSTLKPESRSKAKRRGDVFPDSLGAYSDGLQKALQEGFSKRQKVREFGNTVEEVLKQG